ncbi:MAG: Rho-binding antiterminator [Motiliproteus sp.]
MISCDKHDYIEIACTYRLRLELRFIDGSRISGIAQDTRLNSDRAECLQFLLKSGESELVVLDQLMSMRALRENPHFDVVGF